MTHTGPAIKASKLSKQFQLPGASPLSALSEVDIEIASGSLACIVGPDGAGKTTFLRLTAGLMRATSGVLTVLGIDASKDPQAIQDQISYMPQRFGLYEDLSVQENLDLYADLHGLAKDSRKDRYSRLMEMTDLGKFTDRPAGKLSGGMKQKLGLACTLVRSPALLLLDEPTVGVDPLSRRELWSIIHQLVDEENLSVMFTTAYLDEAEKAAQVIVLHEGKVLSAGKPEELRKRAAGRVFMASSSQNKPARKLQADLMDLPDQVVDAVPQAGEVRVVLTELAQVAELKQLSFPKSIDPRLEDGFMVLFREQSHQAPEVDHSTQATASKNAEEQNGRASRQTPSKDAVIEVKNLVKKFGDFTAVSNTTFSVNRGEIFGLLGPNGAGKTTMFRMLCGLLVPTSGMLRVAGVDLRTASSEARRKVGYVSQKFALYRNLSGRENLEFFGSAYGLSLERFKQRYQQVLHDLGLEKHAERPSGDLPGGYKQRLAMAAALLHEPEILFLDEPTSGADPLARRDFWRRITALSDSGVTIIVTTHFMEEAEYCDRIVIQDAGKVLALGSTQEIRRQAEMEDAHTPMEEVFVRIVEKARQSSPTSQPTS